MLSFPVPPEAAAGPAAAAAAGGGGVGGGGGGGGCGGGGGDGGGGDGGSGSGLQASGADGALQLVVRMRGIFGDSNWEKTEVNEAVCEPSGDIYSGPLVLGVRQGDGVVRSGDAPVKGGG